MSKEKDAGFSSRDRRRQRMEKELAHSVAGHCRGRSLIIGEGIPGLPEAMREKGLKVDHTDELSLPEKFFKTAIMAGFLEHMDRGQGDAVLREVMNRLLPGGRMIVVVPNENCIPEPETTRTFDRKTLWKTLKPLGKVRLATDHPFRWLVMIAVKPREGTPPPNRTKRNRLRVTSRLCRGRVVELGCGEGHLAKAVSDRGLDVVGVDISAGKIARARSHYPNLNFVQSDVLDLELEDASFDTVVMAEILEHVPEHLGNAMLSTAWSLLRPGGRLIVSVPNEDCVPHRNHIRTFDRRSLKKLLRPMGRPKLVTEQPYKWLLMTVEK